MTWQVLGYLQIFSLDPVVLNGCLLPVLPDAFPERLPAREEGVEGGRASLVADHPAGHALHPRTCKQLFSQSEGNS